MRRHRTGIYAKRYMLVTAMMMTRRARAHVLAFREGEAKRVFREVPRSGGGELALSAYRARA